MSALAKLFGFILLTVVWWGLAALMILDSALPCGLGPDTNCEMGPEWTVWLTMAGAVIGYVGMCGLLYRRWIR